jgi:hypothetical protein
MIAAASPHEGKPLPQFVRDLLSAPPQRGGGLHNWLFRTARVLHPFRSRDVMRRLSQGKLKVQWIVRLVALGSPETARG